MNKKLTSLKDNEGGFAAIVIAITLIIVLSLITVGFADLMRNEQRSALDKHLSNQAYYGAESGLNDASQAITHGFTGRKDNCGPYTTAPVGSPERTYMGDNTVGDSTNVYSCLLIDPAPYFLEYGLPQDTTKATEISGVLADGITPAFISKLVISWSKKSSTAPTQFSSLSAHNLPSSWPYATGVLRSTILPLSPGCIGSRDCMLKNSFTSFGYPSTSASPAFPIPLDLNALEGVNGKILDGGCSVTGTPLACNITISNIVPSKDYLFYFTSLYQDARVQISAKDAANAPLRLRNSQTVVDSTGKAQDVLRRVQARIPSQSSYDVPQDSLDIMSGICKQLRVAPISPDFTSTELSC